MNERPNILLITTDQQRFDTIQAAGNPHIYTPHLNWLYNLGLLFTRMRELSLLDNTLILFTSDHGELLGDHHLGAKSVPLEGSAHVPMLLRVPEAPSTQQGKVCPELVCLADVLPTCLRFAGVQIPADAQVEGMDLLSAANGRARRQALLGACETFCWMREGPHKYLFDSRGGSEMLFDLQRDPYEQHELIRAGTHEPIRQELQAKLAMCLQAAGHPAVREGRLAIEPDQAAMPIRNNDWPGFISRRSPREVAH